jgi:hypothetical protein
MGGSEWHSPLYFGADQADVPFTVVHCFFICLLFSCGTRCIHGLTPVIIQATLITTTQINGKPLESCVVFPAGLIFLVSEVAVLSLFRQ